MAHKEGGQPVKAKKFQIPKKLGACADLLYQLRAERIAIEHQAEEIKAQESKLKAHLIEKLGPDQAAEGIVGELATVRVLSEVIPVANDWGETWGFAKKHDRPDLFQRRLNNKAITDLWAEGVEVPGVEKLLTKKLSITKR